MPLLACTRFVRQYCKMKGSWSPLRPTNWSVSPPPPSPCKLGKSIGGSVPPDWASIGHGLDAGGLERGPSTPVGGFRMLLDSVRIFWFGGDTNVQLNPRLLHSEQDSFSLRRQQTRRRRQLSHLNYNQPTMYTYQRDGSLVNAPILRSLSSRSILSLSRQSSCA